MAEKNDVVDAKIEEKKPKKRGRPRKPKIPRVRKYCWEVDLKTDTGEFLSMKTYKTMAEIEKEYPQFTSSQIFDYAVTKRPLKGRAGEKYKNFEFRRVENEGYIPFPPQKKKE